MKLLGNHILSITTQYYIELIKISDIFLTLYVSLLLICYL